MTPRRMILCGYLDDIRFLFAQPSQVVGTGGGVGVVRIKHGATAPALHLSTAAKRRLLEVDLAGSDPALIGSEKRLRGFGDEGDDDDDGHTGGRGERTCGCSKCIT